MKSFLSVTHIPSGNFSLDLFPVIVLYFIRNREFFFDRSPRVFEYILGIYRKGELHLPSSVCPRDFIGELEYWGLSALHLGEQSSDFNPVYYKIYFYKFYFQLKIMDCQYYRAVLCLHPPEVCHSILTSLWRDCFLYPQGHLGTAFRGQV